ncbi:hypothetical protein GCM10023317_05210 [Actinopolymorpha pittospori]|uniref:Uncharacterized protein n=1 Tax=Actinopolymorpha pittospori TaxID=648752 RepID=A0A927MTW6_9ACTN|nr:hypothetical protein [Actinopolymorpha pittospori]
MNEYAALAHLIIEALTRRAERAEARAAAAEEQSGRLADHIAGLRAQLARLREHAKCAHARARMRQESAP